MADVLSAHPDWAERCLPSGFGCLTLLHCAITLNRPEWIPHLLAHGAHPLVEASGGINSINVALNFNQRNSLVSLVIALEELLAQDCTTLPLTFAHTLTELITAGFHCANLIKSRLPPSPDPLPDRVHMPSKRRTACGDSVCLVDSSSIASVEGDSLVAVKFEVCRIPGLLAQETGLLQALYFAPLDEILENSTIEALLQHKWATHGFKLNMISSSWVLLALIAFVIETFKQHLACELALCLLALVRAAAYLRQMLFMGRVFWHSVFHILGVCVVAIQLTLALFHMGGISIEQDIISIAALLIWLDMITHLRAFESTAAILTQTKEICRDLLPFLLILGLVVVMYGHAAMLLSPDTYVLDAMLARYSAIVSGEAISWITDEDGVVASGRWSTENEENGEDTGHLFARAFLLITGSIFGSVVMLNMLIALLCDTFERVQQNVIAIRNRELAGLLLDMECLRKPPPAGAYFFICSQIMSEVKHWTGFLGELKVHIADSMQRVTDQLSESSRQSNEQIKGKLKELDQQLRDVSSQTGNSVNVVYV
eukprot:TRINITY_DN47123_c0_g1_i1.p1 TRINITY_DN47123_c0_g1~~TRINITY_DN47123_c0_g1_i1.p1  ORF type:complete len:571 (+),score=57.10 TRINITY_DN47123_c0_g1_i1:89-1714(+)